MKKNKLFFFICIAILSLTTFTSSLYAQKGSVISVGGSNIAFNSDSQFPISKLSNNAYYLAYEAIPSENISGKFQFTRTIPNPEVSYWDIRMSISYLLKIKDKENPNKGSRLSFPVNISVFYWDLKDLVNNDYGYIGLGAQGGIRYYLTYTLAIEGYYGFNVNHINRINLERFNESVGSVFSKQFTIGLSYFLTK